MILDKIENIGLYDNTSSLLSQALKFLRDTDFTKQEEGKYFLEGDDLFYMVQRCETKPFLEGELEAHKKYIDIQYLVSGEEYFGHAFLDDLSISKPYDTDKDCIFYSQPEKTTILRLLPRMFTVFFPHDAHMPCRHLDYPTKLLKVIMKVKWR
ncbi:MAG: YhcH/YjgK/YiaL family protein [Gammaproteobacteria bacterium]|jgi:YhcH/YjgK/YiaL family protein